MIQLVKAISRNEQRCCNKGLHLKTGQLITFFVDNFKLTGTISTFDCCIRNESNLISNVHINIDVTNVSVCKEGQLGYEDNK